MKHTEHCLKRQKWGDGECECKADVAKSGNSNVVTKPSIESVLSYSEEERLFRIMCNGKKGHLNTPEDKEWLYALFDKYADHSWTEIESRVFEATKPFGA